MFLFPRPSHGKTAFVLAAAFFTGVFGGGFASLFVAPYVEGSISFVVQNERRPAAAEYDYEGYYALKTAEEASRTLAELLRSPGGIEGVYREAGLAARLAKLRSYERVFDVRRADTPFFEVRFRAATPSDAERLAGAITKKLREVLSGLSGQTSTLALNAAPPVLIPRHVPLARNLLYGGSLGLVLAAFSMLFREAIRNSLPR